MIATGTNHHRWLLYVRSVVVYLLRCAWGYIMKQLRRCCCFWRPGEDQYKLVTGDQELITIRPKVYCGDEKGRWKKIPSQVCKC